MSTKTEDIKTNRFKFKIPVNSS